jgi:UDP-N-acetylmuramoyl-L-alanyl-D-glutamate--2,6-diaminopimelate ligase
MTLQHLLEIYPGTKSSVELQSEVKAVCFDSRKLEPGCVFVAIRGAKSDGHQFLAEASAKGAVALIVENAVGIPANFKGAVVKVSDSREALNKIAARFYGNPADELFCIGITGTNGKTTTTHMIEAILNEYGSSTGVIGTIDHHLGKHIWKTELTTPDPLSFQKRLREFKDLGAKAVAIEVSSIGLRQSRVDEVPFDVAIFSNLSRDHLDYHNDMEDYFQAKKKLFAELLKRSSKPHPRAVINADDEYGKRLINECGSSVWSYGEDASAALRFEMLEQGFFGTRFRLRTPMGTQEFQIGMTGLHNVYNATSAIGAALSHGVSLATCAKALSELVGVKGRLESVPNSRGLYIFVDYAHTDGALETVLHYLNAIRKSTGLKNKIITVFGCGGDRDKGKRPLMMKAAAQGSDLVVVTSDNPRTENPDAIIADALKGVEASQLGQSVFQITDRREGIKKAVELAQPGDVILIAGKGHEDYQQIGTVKFPFSDVEVVKEILK